MKVPMETDMDRAIALVEAVHWSMDWDVWGRRRLRYWSSLEEHVRAAATSTATVTRFLSELCLLMKVPSIARIPAAAETTALAVDGAGPGVLRVLREEAPYVVVMVRQHSEARKAAKDKQDKDFEEAGL